MKDKTAYRIELEPNMQEFLQEMAKKYKLSDVGKAVRCLVNYAREKTGEQDNIFATIRCPDC